MWNSSSQYSALATRKLRTSRRPKSKTNVPQSGCSPRRGSPCSYSGGAVEAAERELVLREVRGHPVDDDADAGLVQRVDEVAEVVRVAEARRRRVVGRDLVAPRAAERVLGDRQELDVREAGLAHVLDEFVGQLAVGQPVPPRADVHLVDRHRRLVPMRARPPGEPVVVAPLVARRCARPTPWPAGPRSRTPSGRPCPATGRRRRGSGTCTARRRRRRGRTAPRRRTEPSERIGSASPGPVVEVAGDPDPARVRRPHGERRAGDGAARGVVAAHVRAEHLPEVLVPALADQVQVDLAERRQPAVRVVDGEAVVAVGDLEPVVRRRLVEDRLEDAAVVHAVIGVPGPADHDRRRRSPRGAACGSRCGRPAVGCAPSTPCGLWCAPPTSWSSSSRWTTVVGHVDASVSAVGESGQRRQRDGQPGRPVAGFVDRLVHGLVGLERAQQHGVLARVGAGDLGVAVAERLAVALGPLAGAVGQLRRRSRPRSRGGGRRSRTSAACRRRRAAASRLPARVDGGHRLALEVDQHPAGDGAQRLAEVQVAVDALHGDRRRPASPTSSNVSRRPSATSRRSGTIVDGAVAAGLAHRRGALAQLAGRRLAGAERRGEVGVHLRRRPRRAARPRRRSRRRPRRRAGRASAIRSRTLVLASSQPSVAVVMNSCSMASDVRSRRRRSASTDAEQPRDVLGPEPAERALHLDVGVDARLQPAEHLHDRDVAEDQRGVGLLAGEHEARLVDRDRRRRLGVAA